MRGGFQSQKELYHRNFTPFLEEKFLKALLLATLNDPEPSSGIVRACWSVGTFWVINFTSKS
jgi:hypothetical protein